MEKQLLFEIRGIKYESEYCDGLKLIMNPYTCTFLGNPKYKNDQLSWNKLLEKEWKEDGWTEDEIFVGLRETQKLWTHLPD